MTTPPISYRYTPFLAKKPRFFTTLKAAITAAQHDADKTHQPMTVFNLATNAPTIVEPSAQPASTDAPTAPQVSTAAPAAPKRLYVAPAPVHEPLPLVRPVAPSAPRATNQGVLRIDRQRRVAVTDIAPPTTWE